MRVAGARFPELLPRENYVRVALRTAFTKVAEGRHDGGGEEVFFKRTANRGELLATSAPPAVARLEIEELRKTYFSIERAVPTVSFSSLV